ncbi:MAG: hypothetical protein J6S14_03055 [Clostridia bacterium]|nr:hypothetical protein [Clostridia bacterium]
MDSENGGSFGTTMLVGPAGNGGYPYPVFGGMMGGGGSGFGSGDGAWAIILLIIILVAAGGWNNGGNGGGFGSQPVVINEGGGSVQRGFDQAAIMTALSGIQSGICSGFGDVTQQLYTTQIADMQNAFALQSQFSNCCCENRLGIANLGADIAREACADRAAVSDGVRDIITNQTLGVQRILDQMCADKIDAKNERIADLERQLTMANLAASQTAQTSRILADNAAQTVALEQYLNPVPIPAYIVQNPNCCQQNTGCGCGGF